jgi:hypothetical protein
VRCRLSVFSAANPCRGRDADEVIDRQIAGERGGTLRRFKNLIKQQVE